MRVFTRLHAPLCEDSKIYTTGCPLLSLSWYPWTWQWDRPTSRKDESIIKVQQCKINRMQFGVSEECSLSYVIPKVLRVVSLWLYLQRCCQYADISNLRAYRSESVVWKTSADGNVVILCWYLRTTLIYIWRNFLVKKKRCLSDLRPDKSSICYLPVSASKLFWQTKIL